MRRPFRGSSSYEWQLGPIVLQVPFKHTRHWPCYEGHRLHVWRDRFWRWGK